MCGILVVLAKTGQVDPSACRRALATMHWRGPDFRFSRIWEDRLFLGQTVLSITGEPRGKEGEHQRSPSGRYDVFYNGELYNFQELEARFLKSRVELAARDGTDTEVLTNLHEVVAPADIPPLLDGMYAYVAFDAAARQLHVARDPQGEKSLYLYEDAQWVVIASEIRALLTFLPRIPVDPQALRDYFRTRHLMLFGRTVFQGIRRLQPGGLDTLDLDSLQWSRTTPVRLRDWIDPQRLEQFRKRSLDSLADELENLLRRCVGQMIPRERRYAAVVSGGVDSSLVARYVMQQGHPDVLIAVNHVGKDRISADLFGFERAFGRAIDVVVIDPAAYAAEIWRCQQSCGGPLHSHSFVGQSVQSARVRAAGCRVLFGGDGADELFGGYEAYVGTVSPDRRFSPSPYTAHQEPRLTFLEDDPEELLEGLASAWSEALEVYQFVESPQERATLAMMYCDAAYQLPEVGLRGTDLMSMMWSVETRSVYLRRPIVEFALNLPAVVKATRDGGSLLQTKALLKHLFLRHFPSSLLVKKQGFAGFPNESALSLGDPNDYLALRTLAIRQESLGAAWADRATGWKLINTEYFLRYSGLVSLDIQSAVKVC